MSHQLTILIAICLLPLIAFSQDTTYNLHLMDTKTGASCLDGSATGYYFQEGFGDGKDKFIVYFAGGSFCAGMTSWGLLWDCYKRTDTVLGSSNSWPQTMHIPEYGIQSADPKMNKFHNWNKAYIQYCDGALHQGLNNNPSYIFSWFIKKLYFRGDTNTKVIFKHLLEQRGMKDAKDVMLSGISAGAVAAFNWADYLGSQLDLTKTQYTVAPDGGYAYSFKHISYGMYAANHLFKLLYSISNYEIPFPNQDCVDANKNEVHKCFFGDEIHKHIKSDLFIIQSLYDSFLVAYVLGAPCLEWTEYTLEKCDVQQLEHIQDFKMGMYNSLKATLDSEYRRGLWAPACAGHVFTLYKPFNMERFEIPEGAEGNTLHDTLYRFATGSNEDVALLDEVQWPFNSKCAYFDESMVPPDFNNRNPDDAIEALFMHDPLYKIDKKN